MSGRAPKKPAKKRAKKAASSATRGRVTSPGKGASKKASAAPKKAAASRSKAAPKAAEKAPKKASKRAKTPERAPRAGTRNEPAPAATAKKRGPRASVALTPGRARGASTSLPKKAKKKQRAAPTPEGKAKYQRRIARLMALGYTRAQARGHAPYQKGVMGIKFDKDAAVAVVTSGSHADRMRTRQSLLEAFSLKVDEPVSKFPNRRAWYNRVSKYQGIADWLERLFGIEQPEAFALLMSP